MMHHHSSHHSLPEIPTNRSNNGSIRRRRRRWNHSSKYTIMPKTILLAAALLIVINSSSIEQCTSLMVPTSISFLSSRYTQSSSCCWVQYRKRRRLNEVFRYGDGDDIHHHHFVVKSSCNMSNNRRILYNGAVIRGAEEQVMSTSRTSAGSGSRISTSLHMAQSGSSSDDESNTNNPSNGDDPKSKKKKKKNNDGSSSSNNGPSKYRRVNKGGKDKTENPANKGSSTARNNKQQRTKRKQRNKQQMIVKKGTTKKKGTIQSSGVDTSLAKFKEPKKKSMVDYDQDDIITDNNPKNNSDKNDDVQKRIIQLETLVSTQMSEIQRLQRQVDNLTRITSVFNNVVNTLREAGLRIDEDDNAIVGSSSQDDDGSGREEDGTRTTSRQRKEQEPNQLFQKTKTAASTTTTTDDIEIFGIAPKSVTDAADAAGSSILSAILAGKHRMLVDVRDAELTRDPKLFVEFIELAILPVAAGLEGLSDDSSYIRNRVKIVFPTVKELLSYRKSMALAAPDVVSLSTLGLDPIDAERDNLIVVIAPSPDDVAGVSAMEQLIVQTTKGELTQPVVVMNHHMIPVDMSQFGKFTVVYHLRLLSVQYMTGEAAPEYVAKLEEEDEEDYDEEEGSTTTTDDDASKDDDSLEDSKPMPPIEGEKGINKSSDTKDEEEQALEAAMTHAHEIGVHQGVTRAMVIRAYPK